MTESGRRLCGAPTAAGTPCRRLAGPDGCGRHPAQEPAGDGPGPVRRQVDLALAKLPVDWQTEAARALADAVDEDPEAAKVKELRSLMAALAPGAKKEGGDAVDDLAAQRAKRLADAGGPH